MADIVPNQFKLDLADAIHDWTVETVKIMLLTSTATPTASWASRADVTNEVVGAGYSAGGATLTTPARTLVGSTVQLDGDDTQWAAATITARYAVAYKSNGGAASGDPLIGIWDFGADKTSTAGTFKLQWNAAGLINIT